MTKLITELFIAVFLLCFVFPKAEVYIKETLSKELKTRMTASEDQKPLQRCRSANKLIRSAQEKIGTPYVFGGTSFKTGIDCSYFTQYVCKENGIKIPRTASQQYREGVKVGKKHLAPGDLVFFSTYWVGPSHVGIFMGDNKFIHASSSGVKISNLGSTYYKRRYIGARRLTETG